MAQRGPTGVLGLGLPFSLSAGEFIFLLSVSSPVARLPHRAAGALRNAKAEAARPSAASGVELGQHSFHRCCSIQVSGPA